MVGILWEVLVEPLDGSGHLTERDVEQALYGVPDGASLQLVLGEFNDFSSSAASFLARRTSELTVTFLVRLSARRAGAQFVELFMRAQGQYLAVEVSGLRDRSA